MSASEQQQYKMCRIKRFGHERSELEVIGINDDTEFFMKFADKCVRGRFTGLDLPAGKFPQAWHGFTRWALLDEHVAVRRDQRDRHDRQQWFGEHYRRHQDFLNPQTGIRHKP